MPLLSSLLSTLEEERNWIEQCEMGVLMSEGGATLRGLGLSKGCNDDSRKELHRKIDSKCEGSGQ